MTTLAADLRLALGKFSLAAKFSAPCDGITALFGPSGSGKTTLLLALAGLQRAQGNLNLGDRDLMAAPPHLRGLGLVFQDTRLFPHLTARQNIAYAWTRAPQARRQAIQDVAQFFDITAQLDRPVTNLSGGEKSRVALARAIAAAPDFLLLDEPFAALDGARRRNFITVLRRMHRQYNLPMLVVTHAIDDAAALASHLVALKDGAVVAQGAFGQASADTAFQVLLDGGDRGAALPAQALHSARGGDSASVWLRADTVVLATEPPRAVSTRNILQGTVRDVTAEIDNAALVTLDTADGAVLSRVTQEAVRELDLVPGKTAWALVKAHAL